jgi:hypothetical protein
MKYTETNIPKETHNLRGAFSDEVFPLDPIFIFTIVMFRGGVGVTSTHT